MRREGGCHRTVEGGGKGKKSTYRSLLFVASALVLMYALLGCCEAALLAKTLKEGGVVTWTLQSMLGKTDR